MRRLRSEAGLPPLAIVALVTGWKKRLALTALFIACDGCVSPRPSGRAEMPGFATVAQQVVMPFPARARESLAVRENAACEGCHHDEATEWRASLHHGADTNDAYRRSFAIEPMPFCRSCHAPESDPTREESADVKDLGVGCITCHVTTDGEVLAAPGEPHAPAPHRVVREARFAEPAACASCHEFAFPGRVVRGEGDLMQSTMTEHRGSAASSMSCATCHMPRDSSGRRSHAFVASRDASFVGRAVRVHAERLGPTSVEITIAPQELGHAFPTGDLFRRLALSAEVVGPDHMVLASAARFLTRHFKLAPGTIGRHLQRDDRVRGTDPLKVELDVGPRGRGHPIAWRVSYERVAHPNGVDDDNATVEEELVLGEGTFDP